MRKISLLSFILSLIFSINSFAAAPNVYNSLEIKVDIGTSDNLIPNNIGNGVTNITGSINDNYKSYSITNTGKVFGSEYHPNILAYPNTFNKIKGSLYQKEIAALQNITPILLISTLDNDTKRLALNLISKFDLNNFSIIYNYETEQKYSKFTENVTLLKAEINSKFDSSTNDNKVLINNLDKINNIVSDLRSLYSRLDISIIESKDMNVLSNIIQNSLNNQWMLDTSKTKSVNCTNKDGAYSRICSNKNAIKSKTTASGYLQESVGQCQNRIINDVGNSLRTKKDVYKKIIDKAIESKNLYKKFNAGDLVTNHTVNEINQLSLDNIKKYYRNVNLNIHGQSLVPDFTAMYDNSNCSFDNTRFAAIDFVFSYKANTKTNKLNSFTSEVFLRNMDDVKYTPYTNVHEEKKTLPKKYYFNLGSDTGCDGYVYLSVLKYNSDNIINANALNTKINTNTFLIKPGSATKSNLGTTIDINNNNVYKFCYVNKTKKVSGNDVDYYSVNKLVNSYKVNLSGMQQSVNECILLNYISNWDMTNADNQAEINMATQVLQNGGVNPAAYNSFKKAVETYCGTKTTGYQNIITKNVVDTLPVGFIYLNSAQIKKSDNDKLESLFSDNPTPIATTNVNNVNNINTPVDSQLTGYSTTVNDNNNNAGETTPAAVIPNQVNKIDVTVQMN